MNRKREGRRDRDKGMKEGEWGRLRKEREGGIWKRRDGE